MLRDDLPPRRTGRDRAKWPPHDRTRPQALIPHFSATSASESSRTREAASTGFGVLWFIFDALSNAPPTTASGAGVVEQCLILTTKTQELNFQHASPPTLRSVPARGLGLTVSRAVSADGETVV